MDQLKAAFIARAVGLVASRSLGRAAFLARPLALRCDKSINLLLLAYEVHCLIQLALVQERQHCLQRGLGLRCFLRHLLLQIQHPN